MSVSSDQAEAVIPDSWWTKYHVSTILIVLTVFVAYRLTKWFMDPYFKYKNRKQVKDYESFAQGKLESKAELGTPYLLRDQANLNLELVGLGLVVPAYNEEARLPEMLKTHIEYIIQKQKEKKLPPKVEIVCVDDGSKDKTWQIILQWCKQYPETSQGVYVRGLRQKENQGKGAACKYGALFSRGQNILMLDADGATDFKEIEKILKIVGDVTDKSGKGLGIAIGSRNAGQENVQRRGIRKLLNFCMHMLVRFVLGFGYQDTQCGFKIFSRDAAKRIFPTQHLERWAFDVELLYLARKSSINVAEVPVAWHDVEGSHLNVIDASLTMARDMLMVKMLYGLGVWKTQDCSY